MEEVKVLMVEDNSADRFWLEYVVKSLRLNYSFSSVADGENAVDFLLKRGKHTKAPTPDLIFLDVNLPILNGIEVLRQVPTRGSCRSACLQARLRSAMSFSENSTFKTQTIC